MIGSMFLLYGCVPNGAVRVSSLRRFGKQILAPLKVASICAVFCWAGEAQAGTCADLFSAIKDEARYCGFFCDLKQLQLLQKVYEATCVDIVVPPSLFDLDSVPQEAAQFAGRSRFGG